MGCLFAPVYLAVSIIRMIVWVFVELIELIVRSIVHSRPRKVRVIHEHRTTHVRAATTRPLSDLPGDFARWTLRQRPQQAQSVQPSNYGVRSEDGNYWWDGYKWLPVGESKGES